MLSYAVGCVYAAIRIRQVFFINMKTLVHSKVNDWNGVVRIGWISSFQQRLIAFMF